MRTASPIPLTDPTVRRVLAVADWDLDLQAVVAEMSAHNREQPGQFGLLVPARLHGLDWVGDPRASRPCAERQLLELQALCRDTGIRVGSARIGDPEAVAAITDALADWPAEHVLIFSRKRRVGLPHPLDLGCRVRRTTGLPVTRVDVPSPALTRGSGRFHRRCEPLHRHAALT